MEDLEYRRFLLRMRMAIIMQMIEYLDNQIQHYVKQEDKMMCVLLAEERESLVAKHRMLGALTNNSNRPVSGV